jgi:hypothetical protein
MTAIVTTITTLAAAAVSRAIAVFEPKSVDSILGVFNKTIRKLEKLADRKFDKADAADNRILDLENTIAVLTEESMQYDREGEEALAAAERIRSLIGTQA